MRNGDTAAIATFERYIDRLGRALAVICNILDPDTIVFGGGLSNVAELYSELPRVIGAHVFSDMWRAKLVPARGSRPPTQAFCGDHGEKSAGAIVEQSKTHRVEILRPAQPFG
jgi:predicted NBD/HSP70 family sugar kinase